MSLRDSPLGELKVPLTWTAAIALVVAVVAAAAILLSDRRETFKAEAYGARAGAATRCWRRWATCCPRPAAGPAPASTRSAATSSPSPRTAELKAELKEMRQWRDVAIALKDENARYRTLLGLKTDPPIPMVAARIVTDSRGPFADTRLANAGSEQGVKAGNPVMSENGLVGRVIGVTDGASRVLLLTDIASRTPVMIDRTNARAILTGDGGPNPRLDYLRGRDPMQEGDRVLTSGDGGVLPRGLPVGTAVKGLDGRWRVVLASDEAPIDFVRILLFQDFTQVVNQKELNEMPTPPPTPGPGMQPVAPPKPAAAPRPPPLRAKTADGDCRRGGRAQARRPPKPAAAKTDGAAGKPAAKTPAKPADAAATKPAAKQGRRDGQDRRAARSRAAKPTGAKAAAAKPAATKPTAAAPQAEAEAQGAGRRGAAVSAARAARALALAGRADAAGDRRDRSCSASRCSVFGLQLPEPVFPHGAGLRLGGDPALDPGALRAAAAGPVPGPLLGRTAGALGALPADRLRRGAGRAQHDGRARTARSCGSGTR